MRRVTVRYTWDRLKVSFWFAPLVMSFMAILLSRLMIWLDARIPDQILENSHIILSSNVDQQRTLLVGMATSILATAGVVFSLLTLPLSTVASQYGSRLLRIFLGDRTTQFVLGMFVGAFVYCIASATSIPPIAVQSEGHQLAATFGLLFMLASFASLILLVQHISIMLQAPQIAAAAGTELMEVVRTEIPDNASSLAERSQTSQQTPILVETEGYPIRVRRAGYIQYIDPGYMVTLVQQQDLVIRLLCKPGHFVSPGDVVARVWPIGSVDKKLGKQLCRAFVIGKVRTPTQDVEYAVNQLVEMALRAMSPAINDPFTAITCLDYIGNGLAHFAGEVKGTSNLYDRDNKLRLIYEPVRFDELLNAAFDMLRHASCDNASVLLHMLEVIAGVGQATTNIDRRHQLIRHISLIQTESRAGALIEQDRQLIQQRGETLQMELKDAP